jgi:putative flippase GtrA
MIVLKSTPTDMARFIKFLFVGFINTVFGYGVFALLLFLGLHYALASLFGTILGVIFNFFTTGRLVFQNTDNLLIFKFIGVYAIVYLINLLLLAIIDYFNYNLYIGGFIILLPVAFLAFQLNQTFVFNERIVK